MKKESLYLSLQDPIRTLSAITLPLGSFCVEKSLPVLVLQEVRLGAYESLELKASQCLSSSFYFGRKKGHLLWRWRAENGEYARCPFHSP